MSPEVRQPIKPGTRCGCEAKTQNKATTLALITASTTVSISPAPPAPAPALPPRDESTAVRHAPLHTAFRRWLSGNERPSAIRAKKTLCRISTPNIRQSAVHHLNGFFDIEATHRVVILLRIVFAGRRKHQQHRPSTFVSNILPLQISSVPPYPYRTPRISSTFIHNQVPVVSQSVTRSDPTRPFVHGSQIASYYHFTSTLYRLVIFTHEKEG